MSKEVKAAQTEANKDESISTGDVISYGLGGVASTMPSQYKTAFVMNFLTDTAGLNVGTVGIITMLMTIWDAINDPIIGGIADRTNTKRFGKYRPHMMMGCIMWGISLLLLFFVPNISYTGKLIYYTVILALFSVFYTQFTVPWQALNSVMSSNPEKRNLLLTSRQLAGFVAGAVVGMITMPIVETFSDQKIGWLAATGIVALTSIITGLLSANGAKKCDYYNSIPTPKKITFKGQMNIVTKNKAVICASLLLGIVFLSSTINSAISIYYLKYVVKSLKVLSIQSLLTMLRSIIFIPLMPFVLKKLGKVNTIGIGMILNAFTSICLLFLRENASPTQVILMTFISGAGFTIANVGCLAMIPDCTDYTELHYGTAQAGFINSVVTFTKKLCSSLSTLIVGTTLSLVGYTAGAAITPEIVNSIVNIKIVSPIILLVLTLIVLKIYPISTAYGREMRAKLKVIRAEKAAQASQAPQN